MRRLKTTICPAEVTIRVVGGVLKVPIVFYLSKSPLRFSELRRVLGDVPQKGLIQHLRQLEAAGVVSRKVFAQVPPKVVYSLTPLGRSLRPVVLAMSKWGKCHQRRFRS